MNKLKITLKGSRIGIVPKHKLILNGLGLRKISDTVLKDNEPRIRGMVKKVLYLLNIEEINQ